ncbi:hypothetical protein RKD54_001969 [Pseudarthrobacter sp. SLBN-100]|uniref:hypothetical protein n=1 Tax=Arthrobacter sp. SLBN-100 TaxID=2768450 RepID=UPI00115124B5|nr:hypothetical protein [Arthrobacter sp. SLBN-100]
MEDRQVKFDDFPDLPQASTSSATGDQGLDTIVDDEDVDHEILPPPGAILKRVRPSNLNLDEIAGRFADHEGKLIRPFEAVVVELSCLELDDV